MLAAPSLCDRVPGVPVTKPRGRSAPIPGSITQKVATAAAINRERKVCNSEQCRGALRRLAKRARVGIASGFSKPSAALLTTDGGKGLMWPSRSAAGWAGLPVEEGG
jgi:hypothetical protein